MEDLTSDHPQLGQFETKDTDLSMEQIRQNLRKKETLVEYFITNPDQNGSRSLFVFVVTGKTCHIHHDQIDKTFQGNLEVVLRNLHSFDPYRETPLHYDSLKMALFTLYTQFVLPIESTIKGKELIVVPDEELAYIPFGALIDHYKSESIINYAGLPYLMYVFARGLDKHRSLVAPADGELRYIGNLLLSGGKPNVSRLLVWEVMTWGMMSYAERLSPGALYRSSKSAARKLR